MTRFDLDAFLPYQLALVAGRVSRGFAECYGARYGFSIAEWRIIAHLSQGGPISVRDIHIRADLEKSKVSRAVARLEADGIVAKTENARDRRLVALQLTAKGAAIMDDLAGIAEAYQYRLLARMDEHERQSLRQSIEKISRALDAG